MLNIVLTYAFLITFLSFTNTEHFFQTKFQYKMGDGLKFKSFKFLKAEDFVKHLPLDTFGGRRFVTYLRVCHII